MFDVVLALPRRVFTVAHRVLTATFDVLEAVPRIAEAVDELRATIKLLERLATFAAEELPEVVYQLEAIRGELAVIERRLAAGSPTAVNGTAVGAVGAVNAVNPESPRTG
jgi:hypothetical protein